MHKVAGLLGTLALALLAGCGAGDEPNDADVAFAAAMVEHHAQAVQMANYTIGRERLDDRVAELAEQIRVSQTAEIDTLADYLREWGEDVPETGFATGDSHSHDGRLPGTDHADMPGMMSAAELEGLAAAPDRAFEREWMQMMVEHHRGALAMVDELQQDGRHEGLAELAARMERDQRAEIRDLERWLGGA